MKKMLALLLDCLKLPKNLMDLMTGVMLSESYCAFVVMMKGLGIIDNIPDWLPEVYRDKRHNFETGYARLRFCTPALISAMGSVPEHYLTSRCRTNIPTHLWSFPTAKPDLRIKLFQ